MASPTGSDFPGVANHFQALTTQTLTLVSAYAGVCGPNEKEYYACIQKIVTDIGAMVTYRLVDEGPLQWKQQNVAQAEDFFRNAQEIIQDQVFRGIIQTTSLADMEFPARVAVLDKFIASADSLGNNRRPLAPGEVQVRGGIPIYYGHPINRLIDVKFQPAALPPWFDLSEAQRWIARCNDSHPLCKVPQATKVLFTAHPTWLVDVQRMCLVNGAPGMQYVCLSYLCDTKCFKTGKQSLQELQNQGSLAPPATAASANGGIPATISHAIQLTSQINRRYIWVDSLCLVHDDEAQLEQDLVNMASIFANADLTIVIPSVPAVSGLYGIPDVTPPIAKRDYYRPRWWDTPKKLTERIAEHQKVLDDVSWGSPWRKRAWTFQENYFSNRFLVVNEKSMTWQCRCQVDFEGAHISVGQKTYDTHGQGLRLSKPTFKDYGTLVSAVNSRQLRSPEESLYVFGGTIGALDASWQSGWISGLPSQFFDLALAWYNEKPLRKRASQNSGLMAPSWSWAAWEGPISFLDEPKGKDSVKPLAQWKASPSRRIWTALSQIGTAQGQASSGAQQGGSISDAMRALSISRAAAPDKPPVTHFTPYLLRASVQHLSLHVMEFETAGIPLINKDGDCIGMVTPHEAIRPAKNPSEVTCDVVAVSELLLDGMGLYNVFWIEEVNGVAYRKGVGRVVKEMWLAMKPSTREIILG
ncbi:Heterokaryon incompatibility [Akanthomyces lecanii RCEF 1005]|uniref:Heterokaryon incompatibility n=1 Tax=Akanthomyces lecanii RCEF 1005 TaxID=1081108 RepID=A0A162MT87_CORDF|nr:Heterokaryon incompatibility [Akanthomyces lecanii RCEF 1005]